MCVLACNHPLFCFCCSDMNNRSIAWWLRQIGLSQYTKTLESEYYGLEVCESAKRIWIFMLSFVMCFTILQFLFIPFCFCFSLQGLLNVTDVELRDSGIEDATHREIILSQLSRHRLKLDSHSGDTHWPHANTHTHDTH